MKEHKYKEKCDCCGRWSYKYISVGMELYCEDCYNKLKSKDKQKSKELKKNKKESDIFE